MRKNSYIGITFVILVFGIIFVPKIVDHFTPPEMATIGEVPGFVFTNQDGESISNQDFDNKVYVVEFFFTTCPSICPIMNRNMVKIQNKYFGNPKLGIASFSIDPETDTPKVLKEYAKSYEITNPNWHLLTGEKEKIHELANTGFNLYVGDAPETEGGFEHSGLFALIDKEGFIRSRIDENGNPIIYYNGLEDEGIQMLIEDIDKLF